MKQLVLKELCEQFKVALIGLVILTAMVSMALTSYGDQLQQLVRHGSQTSYDNTQPLLRHELQVQVACFCALFGILLGWLQIRAEQHPDLWAFLVHRPVPRTCIFKSKVIAGLLLYVAGVGLPLLGFVLVVSAPGQVAAPFEWPMALPFTSLFLVGMVWYFAGLLTGLRKARWFVSRGFGLGLPVVVTFALFDVPEFWHALLLVVAAGTVLALAVWGSFQTGGFYREQPAAGKVALTLTSTASALVLAGLLLAVSINFLVSRSGYTYTQYQLTRDGKVLRITQRGFDEADITDLNGLPVRDEKTGQTISVKDLQSRYAFGLTAMTTADQSVRWNGRFEQRFFRQARFFSQWAMHNKILWYLTADGRLVGYHGITRGFVGTLVPPGMAGNESSADARFLLPYDYGRSSFMDWSQPGVLASTRTAYRVDLERREVKPLLTVKNGDVILASSENASSGHRTLNSYALVLTRSAIHFFDSEGGHKFELPYVPSLPEYPQVSVLWLEATNTFAVRFDPDGELNKLSGGRLLTHVAWVNAEGHIRNAMDLPNLPGPARQNQLADTLFIPLIPPGVLVWTWEEPYRIWNLLRILPAVLCAGAGWWLGRRNHFSRTAQAAWAMHHLLFGLPGLLAFLAVQEWPAREACPNCKQSRAVDREQCDHCGADFAPPAKTGTEILNRLG